MSSQPSHVSAPAAAAAAAGRDVRVESLLVVGNDAALAARPASPVQLAHAALRAGFDAVVPASWGDELVAAECARRLAGRGEQAAIFCACPEVANRTLSAGRDLAPFLVSLVPPPVALARYLRALYAPRIILITYAGRCSGAGTDGYDAQLMPEELLRELADRDLAPAAQPDAFEDVVPPDRRRFHSLPGGLPAVDALHAAGSHHEVVELCDGDFAAELAQHLLEPRPKLVDAAVRLGCACAGARSGCTRHPRVELASVEPPRAFASILEVPPWMHLDLDMPAPFAPQSPAIT